MFSKEDIEFFRKRQEDRDELLISSYRDLAKKEAIRRGLERQDAVDYVNRAVKVYKQRLQEKREENQKYVNNERVRSILEKD
ncbi:hypothetical protein DRN69_02775 [Candidatus Pacearchaeota archaeon]|nr:MAG: hypothetical protein DRN69_02775 [Candidatus Pacearchaeota archaeon]